MRRLAPAFVLAAGLAAPAAAQMNQYEARFGPPVDVSVDSLLDMPEQYRDRAVRTHGTLEMVQSGSTELRYAFRGTFGGYVYIFPLTDVAYMFNEGAKRWVGREVEVTGVVGQVQGSDQSLAGGGAGGVFLSIWGYLGPPDEKPKKHVGGPDATLEELVTRPDRYDGKTVTVVGQFRGENLFGDLPSSSRARSSDWVIKEDVFAAWVTGKKSKGPGWSLDASLKRDTGKWMEVTGRVRVSKGIVTLEAIDVSLTKAPDAKVATEAKPEPTPPPPPRPPRPPMVAFSLPVDGERDVPPDSVFQVQFSHDIDEASLKGRVLLRYAGRVQPGDNALDAVRFSYDGGLRTLHVDPGDLLRPGRIVEIVLLPGIVDLDGKPLETRPGIRPGSSVDVLRFQVASPGLAGGPGR